MNTPQYVAVKVGDGYEIRRVDAEYRSTQAAYVIGGAVLGVIGLTRRTLPGLAMLAGGAGLAYYGMTGRNPLASLRATVCEAGKPQGAPSYQHGDQGPSKQEPQSALDEAAMESFPASDPPARHAVS